MVMNGGFGGNAYGFAEGDVCEPFIGAGDGKSAWTFLRV